MSFITVKAHASGTGTVTIEAPNTNTNQTLLLPDGSGTIITGPSSLTANAVLLGNAAGQIQTISPGTSGNVLSSTGVTWVSAIPSVTTVTGTLAVANGGTGVTTSTGTGATVLSNSPSLTTPALGTPTAGVLTNCTGLPVAGGGTGSATAAAAKIALEVVSSATGSEIIPAGTTAQRDASPAAGYFRYNTTTSSFEGYTSAWGSVGGGATGAGGDTVFQENQLIVTTNYTLTTGKSAMSVGPITLNSGVVVSIPSGYRWVIL